MGNNKPHVGAMISRWETQVLEKTALDVCLIHRYVDDHRERNQPQVFGFYICLLWEQRFCFLSIRALVGVLPLVPVRGSAAMFSLEVIQQNIMMASQTLKSAGSS